MCAYQDCSTSSATEDLSYCKPGVRIRNQPFVLILDWKNWSSFRDKVRDERDGI